MALAATEESLRHDTKKTILPFVDSHTKKLPRPKLPQPLPQKLRSPPSISPGKSSCSSRLLRPALPTDRFKQWGGPSWGWDSSPVDARSALGARVLMHEPRSASGSAPSRPTSAAAVPVLRPVEGLSHAPRKAAAATNGAPFASQTEFDRWLESQWPGMRMDTPEHALEAAQRMAAHPHGDRHGGTKAVHLKT